MRVMLLNNYSMREAKDLVARGEYPPQHLYGFPAEAKSRGDVHWSMPRRSIYDLAWLKHGCWQRARTILVRLVGDPLQQFAALQARPDVVFSADQWSARGLLLLRRLRLIRSKMLVLVHHPPRTRLENWILQSADRRVFLSEHTRDAVRGGGQVLPWGPDLDATIYRRAKLSADHDTFDFIAAGKTNRDCAGLADAALRGRLSGVIYDGRGRTEYSGGTCRTVVGPSTYSAILKDMAAARSVIIPLRDGNVMSGLTEIADALALNKPILITPARALPQEMSAALRGSLHSTSAEGVLDAIDGLRKLNWRSQHGLRNTHNLTTYAAALDAALSDLSTDHSIER